MYRSTTSRARRGPVALLLFVIALVASGCYKSDIGVKVNDDGSGTVDIKVAIDPDAVKQLNEQFGGDTGDIGDAVDPCDEIQTESQDTSGLPPGTEVEPYEDDGFCGVHISAPFEAGTDIGSFISNDIMGAGEEDSTVTFQDFTITDDGNGSWTFSATTVASSDAAGMDTSLFESFMKDASSIVRIDLPGKTVESNADREEDGYLVWDLDPLGENRTLSARTEPGEDDGGTGVGGGSGGGDDDGGGTSAVVWIVVGVLVVAAVVGGVFLWRRGKSRPAPATPGGPGAPVGSAYAPPTGAPFGAADPAPAATPATPSAPAAAATPAGDGPQWDAQRGAYIQWDAAGSRWMQYDDAAKEWRPL
jgi:hypothetical protein